jgi:hypothetical protein
MKNRCRLASVASIFYAFHRMAFFAFLFTVTGIIYVSGQTTTTDPPLSDEIKLKVAEAEAAAKIATAENTIRDANTPKTAALEGKTTLGDKKEFLETRLLGNRALDRAADLLANHFNKTFTNASSVVIYNGDLSSQLAKLPKRFW